ncbi:MAG TPA: ABC transporter ATP-binding protein [Methanomassiliicoccales archaeon]|nr:ABC transporter ATP-binding protein [Methanomassiliicoccales archaeon]
MADNGLVVLSNVSKSYRNVVALRGVSLELRRGETFGYIGPNGAGKTTTIRIMVGLLGKYSGDVTINGVPLQGNKEKVNRMLGYVPQKAAFQEWRTVDQALSTFGRLSGIPRSEIDAKIAATLERIGITEVRNRKVGALSGGTLQKVGLAQAIMHEPELLVLDEPVAGLDPESRYHFKELFRDFRKEGKTVFFSSHILSDVEDLADRIGILSAGQLVHVGTMEELKEQARVGKQVSIELSMDQGAMVALKKVEGYVSVDNIALNRFIVHLEQSTDLDAAIHELITELIAQGSRIRSISAVSPTLEQLYVNYLAKGVHQ